MAKCKLQANRNAFTDFRITQNAIYLAAMSQEKLAISAMGGWRVCSITCRVRAGKSHCHLSCSEQVGAANVATQQWFLKRQPSPTESPGHADERIMDTACLTNPLPALASLIKSSRKGESSKSDVVGAAVAATRTPRSERTVKEEN